MEFKKLVSKVKNGGVLILERHGAPANWHFTSVADKLQSLENEISHIYLPTGQLVVQRDIT